MRVGVQAMGKLRSIGEEMEVPKAQVAHTQVSAAHIRTFALCSACMPVPAHR